MARIKRTCSCGRVHDIIPATARYQKSALEGDPLAGWYWECECGTTLFIPEKNLKTYIEAAS